MYPPPNLRYRLRSRSPGSFGKSRLAKAAEWITTTWVRFDIFCAWIGCFIVILATPVPNYAAVVSKLPMLILSPLVAIIIYIFLKAVSIILYFVPGLNVAVG